MISGVLQKNSLVDYPGKLSCVFFLPGCNFRCPYCHNPHLVNGQLSDTSCLDEKAFYDFLESRQGLIDGVVISGGEPTLNKDLPLLCKKIKKMGFLIKLDTNGSRPGVLRSLIHSGLVDYIAMDIKTDPFQYSPVITKTHDPTQTLTSIATIMNSSIPYEFRTTCVKPIVDKKSIQRVAMIITGAERYVLQRFCEDHEVLNPQFLAKAGAGHTQKELQALKTIADPWVKECRLRP